MNNQIPVYVISLAQAVERRVLIEKQLKKYNINYSIIDAFNKQDISEEEINKANEKGVENRLNRRIVSGELACHFSHVMAYKKIANSKEGVGIIVEDDVIFDDWFKNICEDYLQGKLIPNDSIFMLGVAGNEYKKTVITSLFRKFKIGGVNAYKTISSTKYFCSSACGYLIKKQVAKKLIVLSQKSPFLADEWCYMKREKCFKTIFLAVCVHHPDNWEVSDIEKERKYLRNIKNESLFYKVLRIVYRKSRIFLKLFW